MRCGGVGVGVPHASRGIWAWAALSALSPHNSQLWAHGRHNSYPPPFIIHARALPRARAWDANAVNTCNGSACWQGAERTARRPEGICVSPLPTYVCTTCTSRRAAPFGCAGAEGRRHVQARSLRAAHKVSHRHRASASSEARIAMTDYGRTNPAGRDKQARGGSGIDKQDWDEQSKPVVHACHPSPACLPSRPCLPAIPALLACHPSPACLPSRPPRGPILASTSAHAELSESDSTIALGVGAEGSPATVAVESATAAAPADGRPGRAALSSALPQ